MDSQFVYVDLQKKAGYYDVGAQDFAHLHHTPTLRTYIPPLLRTYIPHKTIFHFLLFPYLCSLK